MIAPRSHTRRPLAMGDSFARQYPPLHQPRALPELDAAAHHAWREGWWQGFAVGLVMGVALVVVFLLKR